MWSIARRLWSAWKNMDAGISLAGHIFAVLAATTFGAAIIAWLSTTWGWYWHTFSWAGVAIAFLVAWLVFALGVFLIGFGVARWRGDKTSSISEDDPGYSDNPQAEATDKQAYKEILAFAVDHVVPACRAQIRLQESLISRICDNKKIANLANIGLRTSHSFKTSEFWEQYERLASGLIESPNPIIKFEAIIDCIAALEKDSYKIFSEQFEEIAAPANIDVKTDANVRPTWSEWRERHNALIDAYEAIKRDPRFGKLLRPARPSRWGNRDDQQKSDGVKAASDSKSDDRRRDLLKTAKTFISETVNKNPDYDYFQHELEKQRFFLDLKPYLTEGFVRALVGGRVIIIAPEGSNMPGIAWRFLDEIERLEREWNIR
jgi:hypothetical protein